MITMSFTATAFFDGATVVQFANVDPALDLPTRKLYVTAGSWGVVDPSAAFAGSGTGRMKGWRLDAVSFDALGVGFVDIRDMFGTVIVSVIPDTSIVQNGVSRSWPVPPGSTVRLENDTATNCSLSFTELPDEADVAYCQTDVTVNVEGPPA